MVTGLVEPAGQVSGQRLLVAAPGVFVQLTAGDGQTGRGHGQRLGAPRKLGVVCRRRRRRRGRVQEMEKFTEKCTGARLGKRIKCELARSPPSLTVNWKTISD